MSYPLLKKYTIVLVAVLGFTGIVSAQQDARAFLQKAQTAYQQSAYLGFRVKYLYSNAGEEAKPMDSLSGEIQMDKSRCRMVVDGTETIVTGKYIIQVMEDDKSIYLSKSANPLSMNPVQLLDSAAKQLNDLHATVTTEGRWSVLSMQFPRGGTYTQIRMVMDPATGYLSQITYGIHTAAFVSPDQMQSAGRSGGYSPEGRIDMFFSHYEKGGFGDAVFDENKFFTHVADRYEPTGRYKDYHIFLASSNL